MCWFFFFFIFFHLAAAFVITPPHKKIRKKQRAQHQPPVNTFRLAMIENMSGGWAIQVEYKSLRKKNK